jgi:hypothetical protein
MARDPKEILKGFVPPINAATLRAFQQLKFGSRTDPHHIAADFFATQLPSAVCQGDVLGPLPMLWYDTDGQRYEENVLAMLISPSCDYDNDAIALFAPCFPLTRYSNIGFYASIVAQEKASLFYLAPTADREALVVDLSHIQPFPTRNVLDGLATGQIQRVCSFTLIGYVGMILKLTYHLMRAEAEDEARGTAQRSVLQRLSIVGFELARLAKYLFVGGSGK